MSWREAPVYLAAHRLALEVLSRCEQDWPGPLPRLAGETATNLVLAIGRALTFPDARREAVQQADEAVLSLRLLLRLAEGRGKVSPGWLLAQEEALQDIGRQIGGWRKRVRQRGRRLEGAGPPPQGA